MKFFLFVLLSFGGITVFAQDGWKVCFDKKILLSASEESEEKNVIRIFSADLKKYKKFTVRYKESEPQKGWQRTIMAYDEKNIELIKQKGSKFSMKSGALKNLFQISRIIKIYTISLPTDPNLAAQVRVRRVHLCTLVME